MDRFSVMKLGILGMSLSLSTAHAQIVLGAPGFGGTGCPASSQPDVAIVSGASGGATLEVRLPNYVAHLSAGQSFARAQCQGAIPILADSGRRLAVTRVETVGRADLQGSEHAQVRSEVFFNPESTAQVVSKALSGTQGSFRLRSNISAISDCGGEQILRVAHSVLLQSPSGSSGANVEIRTLRLKLREETCQ